MNHKELQPNTLVQWNDPASEPRIERVLALDRFQESIFCIDIKDPHAVPTLKSYAEISSALTAGSATILKIDPYIDVLRNDEDFSPAECATRDRAWPILKCLLETAGEEIYWSRARGEHVRKAAIDAGVTRETIYRWLRRYWQRGQNPNALLADFKASGRPGARPAKDPDSPKRGRRSAEEIQIEKETGVRARKGVNITDEMEARCRAGIKEFFMTRDKLPLSKTYLQVMAKHFIGGYIWESNRLKPVPLPVDERPTYWQFRYIYYKNRKLAEELAAREGKPESIAKRPRVGTRFKTQFGPMMACELDATPGDTVLVHSITRVPIGTPTIYRIHDLFSGMIVGLFVSFEPESWSSAMLAIDNMVADKVAFCQEYDILIEELDWPVRYMCRHFHSDNGSEWKWYASDNIPAILNASVHNLVAYRGDLKPIVEATHNAIKEQVDRGLPGNLLVKPQAGEPDFRTEPMLDLRQYTQLQIRAALRYNLYHRIKNYPLTQEMIVADVHPYPLELWNWGVTNLGPYYQEIDRDIVRRGLLPRDDARITGSGIQFRGLSYSSDHVLKSGLIELAAIKSQNVRIAYDPRTVDYIYLPLEEGRIFDRCELTDRWQGFSGQSWAEITAHRARNRAQEQARRGQNQQGVIEDIGFQRQIVEQAARMTNNAQKTTAKNPYARGGSVERNDEKRHQREASKWNDLASNSNVPPPETAYSEDGVTTTRSSTEGAYIPDTDDLNLIREVRRRQSDEAASKQAGISADPERRSS